MEVGKVTIYQDDKYRTILYPHFTSRPKGSILVLHGIAEHHERYIAFANYMNEQGYDVYLYDHRGHGIDKKIEELGLFAESNGSKRVICDAIQILKYIKKANRGEKLILFGHSMGSLIGRNVIQYYDAIDGFIICGTANPSAGLLRSGLMLSGVVKKFKGSQHRSPLLSKCVTGGKRYSKISNRTAFDWLSRDNTLVGTYIHDPYCGFVCTASLYQDLLRLTLSAVTIKMIKHTRRDLPMLIISGSHDPVGNFGKDVAKLFSTFQRLDFSKVDCTIYEECRHELLNEFNNKEIMHDIYKWISDLKLSKEESSNLHTASPKLEVSEDENSDVTKLVQNTLSDIEAPETEGEKRLARLRAEKRAKQARKLSEADDDAAVPAEDDNSSEGTEDDAPAVSDASGIDA